MSDKRPKKELWKTWKTLASFGQILSKNACFIKIMY